MAPKWAKDNHARAHTRSDIVHRTNRGQWAGINNQRGHFATVLHQGDAPSRPFPPDARPPSILLLGRILRGRSNCAERSSVDRCRYTQSVARHTRAVQSARSHDPPHQELFRRLAPAGDPWDSFQYPPRAVSTISREAAKGGECSERTSLTFITQSAARRACSLRSFAVLGNLTGFAVFDARLGLREIFDSLSACARSTSPEKF
jgi:hypothetical protein